MKRIYDNLAQKHFKSCEQMLFLAGPRQVGKTTVSKNCKKLTEKYIYLNWDFDADQQLILDGAAKLIQRYEVEQVGNTKVLLAFDELHKFKNWRNFLKGLYDKYKHIMQFVVTGSARFDIFKVVGDSLMGRYFSYCVHPISVAELVNIELPVLAIREPRKVALETIKQLLVFGGFPEPFLKQDLKFHRQWNRLRTEQLFNDDIRDLTKIAEIAQLKLLTRLLSQQSGSLINYASLANKVQVTSVTIQKWLYMLQGFYYCFTIQPWSTNITRSLIKQPKVYLWDWSEIDDLGMRYENLVACALKKAVDFWNESGFGEYGLYFVRDKEKQEVDFLVTQGDKPYVLVEAKVAQTNITKSMYYYAEKLKPAHAFNVVLELDYIDKNCFDYKEPVTVPAATFLSQLV